MGDATADWACDRGEELLRVDYPLTKTSVVFDVGAHVGKWSEAIWDRHRCRVFAFEPVMDHCRRASERLEGKAEAVYRVGLGATLADREMCVNWDASSALLPQKGPRIVVPFWTVGYAMKVADVAEIDLLKLNVEGAEFEIMESLLTSSLIAKIGFIQVQYHQGVERGEERYRAIVAKLQETHLKQWDYGWMWSSWGRRV